MWITILLAYIAGMEFINFLKAENFRKVDDQRQPYQLHYCVGKGTVSKPQVS